MIHLYRQLENWWFQTWPKQIRFWAVGGFNTVFSYLIFVGLEWLSNYQLALPLTYLIGINVSIFTMRHYVFRAEGHPARQYGRAVLVYAGLILCNYAFLWLAIDCLKLAAWIAQAVFGLVSAVLLYFLHEHVSFRD